MWIVFDKNGKCLFKTNDKEKINLEKIPILFQAKYIVENPVGFDPLKSQKLSYDIVTNNVVISEQIGFEEVNSFQNNQNNIIDDNLIESLITKTSNDLILLSASLTETKELLDLTIIELNSTKNSLQETQNELNFTKNSLQETQNQLSANVAIVDSTFTNIE